MHQEGNDCEPENAEISVVAAPAALSSGPDWHFHIKGRTKETGADGFYFQGTICFHVPPDWPRQERMPPNVESGGVWLMSPTESSELGQQQQNLFGCLEHPRPSNPGLNSNNQEVDGSNGPEGTWRDSSIVSTTLWCAGVVNQRAKWNGEEQKAEFQFAVSLKRRRNRTSRLLYSWREPSLYLAARTIVTKCSKIRRITIQWTIQDNNKHMFLLSPRFMLVDNCQTWQRSIFTALFAAQPHWTAVHPGRSQLLRGSPFKQAILNLKIQPYWSYKYDPNWKCIGC